MNEPEVAYELLEKRSAIYSSRPRLVFGGEMCGLAPILSHFSTVCGIQSLNLSRRRLGANSGLGFLPYVETLRATRKILHSYIGTAPSLKALEPLESLEACRLVQKLIEEPERRTSHIHS